MAGANSSCIVVAMWQQITVVTRFEPGRVWLKSKNASACSSCSHNQSCGTASLTEWLPVRELILETPIALEVGDKVVLGIEEDDMFTSVFLMYFLPLLSMLLVSIVWETWLPDYIDYQPVAALASLIITFALIRSKQSKQLKRPPRILSWQPGSSCR